MFVAFLLSLLMIGSPVSADSFWQNAAWTTKDGVNIVGLYHPAARSGAYTWVLLHGYGSTKGEWDDFSRKLAQQGSGILIYDARGHGESQSSVSGEKLDYRMWGKIEGQPAWPNMAIDLASAVQMLGKRYSILEKSIAVGGASLGANVALVYAASHSQVPALILLSPGMEYAGIQSAAPYKSYQGRPVFMAASPSDAYAYSSVQQLAGEAPSPAQVVVEGKGGHGVQMFKDQEFTAKLLEWMKGLDGNRNRRPS